MSRLFEPLELGALRLKHRVVMAPLTRTRATDRFVPPPTAIDYYGERATPGGLLITEATAISPETPYSWAPGIYTDEQEQEWKRIVDRVHSKGGLISCQLWHLGRAVHPSWANNEFLKSLNRPLPTVSASAVAAPTTGPEYPSEKPVPLEVPRALETEEIEGRLVDDYRRAAKACKRAGFDAVEVHAAHGYLLDQFLNDSTNQRTDKFGGSIENRTRALRLVLDAVVGVYGADRVGVRLSPTYTGGQTYYGTKDSNPEALYPRIVESLDKYNLAYLLLSEPRWTGGKGNIDPRTDTGFGQPLRNGWARSVYKGKIIGAGGFTPASAKEQAKPGAAYDAVAFGRWFISNPDLVERLRNGSDLNIYDRPTFYIRDPVKGYVDYPRLKYTEEDPKRYEPRAVPVMKQSEIGLTINASAASKL